MIGSLRGTVESQEDGHCVIETAGGVGYLVQASSRTLASLPPAPAVVRILVETFVREDAITLYGFATAAERAWFRLLTTVQGVGPKVALAILSALSADELSFAIASGDRTALGRASGVGPKLAARLALELREKAGTLALPVTLADGIAAPNAAGPAGPLEDALSALMNLGYRRPEAQAALSRATARLGDETDVAALIPAALRELAR
ncbi:MAG TPA: Holliday junction branch migration protein RuvA [Acidisoma sp.]|jgi:Holliday junction DNA helicase RuvA|uniref:Holliday junction branch migration protein RuvA n=1 Tax=Acidisoma sp. TaxID=1872115 RepID=UPI002C34957D|nr:Holliday junction branch migration protein RuvA [Acidisoma sp.]HTI01998.1 Holliday junction branch migration protein RuvA [Acidisoma sp.]